jgi:hypothetical protein
MLDRRFDRDAYHAGTTEDTTRPTKLTALDLDQFPETVPRIPKSCPATNACQRVV